MDEGNKKNTKTDWLKKNIFNIIFALIFGIGGYLLWSNTRPKEPQAVLDLIKVIQENTRIVTLHQQTIYKTHKITLPMGPKSSNNFGISSIEYLNKNEAETSKKEDVPECYTIRLDDFENDLKAVALVSRQEAAEDYHKSFSIFVAMLALFGIGFPAFVSFIQHNFNEKDLNKIEIIAENAKNATGKAMNATNEVKNAIMQINGLGYNVFDNMIAISNGLIDLFGNLTSVLGKDFTNIMLYYYHGQGCLYVLKRYLFNNDFKDLKENASSLDTFLESYNKCQRIISDEKFKESRHNNNEMRQSLIDALDNVIKNLEKNDSHEDKEEREKIQTDLKTYKGKIENITILEEEETTK